MILRALFALLPFGEQMADHLWQSTLFVVLAAMLAFVLRKNQARVRYWIWLTASVKFLIPFSLLIALGGHLAKPRASAPAQTIVYSAVDFSQPFAGLEFPDVHQMAPSPATASLFHLLPGMVVAVWLVGIGVVLFRWAMGWVRISRMVHRGVPLGEGAEVEALRRVEASLGVREQVGLVLSRDWMEPGLFGIFRPVLIWPAGISEHLDEMHVEAILAHEVCHARRRDNLTAILHMMVEAIFWFHPLVWWMGARLEEERERACDEEVSLLYRRPQVYAESILKVCKFCSESPLACVSGITGADLKKRIMQIMTERAVRKLDFGRKLLLLTVSAAVVATPLAIGMLHTLLAYGQVLYTSGPLPSFEVATIRPMPNGYLPTPTPHGGSIVRLRFTPKMMIMYAYNLPDYSEGRILNGAGWTEDDYEVEGKISDSDYAAMQKMTPAEKNQQIQLMVQSLLKDRMKLKVHLEKREETVYALEVAKGGLKLAPAQEGIAKGFGVTHQGQNCQLTANGGGLDDLAELLGRQPEIGGRSVVDKTGITGSYDVALHWTRTGSAAAVTDDASTQDENGPSLFTAIQEQLGLRLATTKGQVDYVIVDHIEKPTVDGAEVPTQASVVPMAQAHEKPSAQADAAYMPTMTFDVASIREAKRTDPMFVGGGFQPFNSGNLKMTNVPIVWLLEGGYGVEEYQISGMPNWVYDNATIYNIEAKADSAADEKLATLTKEQVRLQQEHMFQVLLAERFNFKAHWETGQGPVLNLVAVKGAKLHPGGSTPPTAEELKGFGDRPVPPIYQRGDGELGYELVAHECSMADLASYLSGFENVNVVDTTGLGGKYDFVMRYSQAGQRERNRNPEIWPSIKDALEDQLGLKFENGKGPTKMLVVDHIDNPSAN